MDYPSKINKLLLSILVTAIILGSISLTALTYKPAERSVTVIVSLLLLTTMIGAGVIAGKKFKEIDSFEKGEKGEKLVQKELERLANVTVINNLSLPGLKGDIDHLVITNKGIFVLDTKNIKGWVHAYEDKWWSIRRKGSHFSQKSFSKQAKRGAVTVSRIIEDKLGIPDIFVTPIVVLVNKYNPEDIRTTSLVHVTQIEDLVPLIQQLQARSGNGQLVGEDTLKEVVGTFGGS